MTHVYLVGRTTHQEAVVKYHNHLTSLCDLTLAACAFLMRSIGEREGSKSCQKASALEDKDPEARINVYIYQ